MTPLPCGGGTVSNATDLFHQSQCDPVGHGFWAPAGSAEAIACTSRLLRCPGYFDDNEFHAGQPIILEEGTATVEAVVNVTEVVSVAEVSFGMTLSLDDDETFNATATRHRLAALYNISPELIVLELRDEGDDADRRRLTQSLKLQVRIVATSKEPILDSVTARVRNVSTDAISASLGVQVAMSAAPVVTQRNETVVVGTATVDKVIQCDPGFSCGTGTAVQCAPGTVAPNARSVECTPCAPGTYQSHRGGTECLPCEQGHYCELGAAAPLPCEAGTHSDRTDLASSNGCLGCPVGHFCGRGSAVPTPCPLGTHSGGLTNLSNVFCHDTCPLDVTAVGTRQRVTLATGAVDSGDCVCQSGFYMALSGNCTECPSGTECFEAGVVLRALPVKPDMWRVSNRSALVQQCTRVQKGVCLGGNDTSHQCAEGHRGPWCAVCADGYFRGATSRRCERCSGNSTLTLALSLALLALLALCYATWRAVIELKGLFVEGIERLAIKLENLISASQIKLKILISTAQILTALGVVFSIPYPAIYLDFLQV